jgi:hypothetical protein
MQLPGRLCRSTLGDLLGELHRGRASGVLELVECVGMRSGRSHHLHLESGLVRHVETSLAVPRLGEILRQEGFIGEEASRRLARSLLEQPAKRTGEILIEQCLVRPDHVSAALRRQLRVRLEALFSLQDACIHFHVARPGRPGEVRSVPLSPQEFLHGRPRARDREAGPRPGPRTISRRRRALTILGLSEAADRRAVQQAFRGLAARLHPDRHPGAGPGELATLMRGFAEITAAYHELVA